MHIRVCVCVCVCVHMYGRGVGLEGTRLCVTVWSSRTRIETGREPTITYCKSLV